MDNHSTKGWATQRIEKGEIGQLTDGDNSVLREQREEKNGRKVEEG
jgi:hypothetical protein